MTASIFSRKRILNTLILTINRREGGVRKRIDENRELLELLNRESPQLLQKCPWVVGWLKSQDEYLLALAMASGSNTESYPEFPKRIR